MKKISLSLCVVLAIMLVAALAQASAATPSMTPIPSMVKPVPYQPIAEQLGAQLQSLVATPVPANEEGDEANQEPPPTFGTRALNVVINVTEILRGEAQHFVTDFAALQQLTDWLTQQKKDPHLLARWEQIGADIYATAGVAFLGALALEFLLYPLRHSLRKRSPRRWHARLAVVLGLFFLRAVPIAVFLATSVLLLNQYDIQKLSRFLIMNVVYALALARTTVSFLRGALSPKADHLRFVPATKAQAVYGFGWLRSVSLLIIFGYFFIDVARAVHVPEASVSAFINTLGLILVLMGVVVIVQIRAFVAQLLRGDLSAAQHDLSWFNVLRLWFARHWHRLAVAYLLIGYVVAATGIQNGLMVMLRGTLLTLAALVGLRLLLREIHLWEMRSQKSSTAFYNVVKGASFRLAVVCLAIAAGLAAWGVDLVVVANTPLGHRLLGSALSIGMTLLVLGLVYEFFSSVVDHHLTPRKSGGRVVEVSARARTLLPMIRNALFVVLLSILGVVVLSEAGVNIAPLLAGAGVLGVAVGFGSQTLVKDFLTGLFIVLENTIAVGDFIKVGDHSGTVEAMSMRTIRLRDLDGNLHILPFSEMSMIVNQTRNFAYALFKVNVAVTTDLDKAVAAIHAVGGALQSDPMYSGMILEPVEFMGVESLNDASITLMGRLRTAAGKQWAVRRMFLFALKQRFDQDGIGLPNTATSSVRIEKN